MTTNGGLTPSGRGVLAGSMLSIAVGYVLASNELRALGVAGLALVAVAAALVLRRPTVMVERRLVPDRAVVGDVAEGSLTVTNTGAGAAPAMVCRETAGDRTIDVSVPRLRAGQAVTVTYRAPTTRRAVVDVGPLVLRRRDPFGLVALEVAHGGMDRLWVHPRAHVLPSPPGHRRDQDGLIENAPSGDRVFHALREYVVGDDLRRVHWKATAHRGSLMVREHVDPARPDVTVVLDDRRSVLTPDRFELAVDLAASVACTVHTRGGPVRLRTTAGPTSGGSRPLDRLAVLDTLAGVAQSDGGDLGALAPDAGGTGALVVVTGAPSPDDGLQLSLAARRVVQLVVVAVVAPGEPAPAPPPGTTLLAVTDAGSFVDAWTGLR